MALIKEINELRREVKTLKHTASSGGSTGAGRKGPEGGPRRMLKDAQAITVTPAVDNTSAELRQELDTLRRHVDMLHAELAARWASAIAQLAPVGVWEQASLVASAVAQREKPGFCSLTWGL